jgi:hypothetical protein
MKRIWLCLGLLVLAAQAGAQRAPWRLSTQPIMTIGSEEGELPYQLERVTGAVRLPDGLIVVGNSGSSELRFFDAKGKHIKSAGRRGAGPGEFGQYSNVTPLLAQRDRLMVQDAESQRVNVFDLSGRYLRQFRFEAQPTAKLVSLVAADSTGIVGQSLRDTRLQGNPGDILESTWQVALFDSLGMQRNLLFDLSGRRRLVHSHQGITHYPFIPFSAEPAIAFAAARVFVVRGDSAVVEVWSSAGRRVATYRWPAERTRVRDIWARYKSAELATMTRERDRVLYTHYFDMTLPLPEYVPVASQLKVDAAGNLWIERSLLPWETERRWDVLNGQGRFLGTVSTPRRLNVYQIGTDFVLGRARDSLDIEQIQLWRLTRG